MKKQLFTALAGVLAVSTANSQGLYNIGLGDDEAGESLPLRWTVGASVGYDDNATPLGSDIADSDGSIYLEGYVQANYVSSTPKTTLDAWGRVGLIYYIDGVEQNNGSAPSISSDDTFFNASLGLNYTNRISERLRFSSRNWVSYELEPDYDYGLATDRRVGQYLRYSTDNSIGYRWSERFGTIAGYRFTGVTYDDFDGNDFRSHTVYAQGRYRLSPSTVATAGIRYSFSDGDAGSSDGRITATGGIEHRFSPNSVGIIRAGASLTGATGPFLEGTYSTQVTGQLGLRAFVRYETSDRPRRIGVTPAALFQAGGSASTRFDETDILRIGVQANYVVNPRLTLFAGVNYINTSYDSGSDTVSTDNSVLPISSLDEDIFNANVGFSLSLSQALSVNGSYNYTTSSSDSDVREYDRNRFQVGVTATF